MSNEKTQDANIADVRTLIALKRLAQLKGGVK
jgi:hypothetical protein